MPKSGLFPSRFWQWNFCLFQHLIKDGLRLARGDCDSLAIFLVAGKNVDPSGLEADDEFDCLAVPLDAKAVARIKALCPVAVTLGNAFVQGPSRSPCGQRRP